MEWEGMMGTREQESWNRKRVRIFVRAQIAENRLSWLTSNKLAIALTSSLSPSHSSYQGIPRYLAALPAASTGYDTYNMLSLCIAVYLLEVMTSPLCCGCSGQDDACIACTLSSDSAYNTWNEEIKYQIAAWIIVRLILFTSKYTLFALLFRVIAKILSQLPYAFQ